MQTSTGWAKVASRNLGRRAGAGVTDADTGATPRSHWRQKSLLVNGSSNTNYEDKSFAADICLVAGGVSKNATTDKLTEYLRNKGLEIVNCELLTNPAAIDKVRLKSLLKLKTWRKQVKPRSGHSELW